MDRLDSQLLIDLQLLEDNDGGDNLLDFDGMLEGLIEEQDDLNDEMDMHAAQQRHGQGQGQLFGAPPRARHEGSNDLNPSTSDDAVGDASSGLALGLAAGAAAVTGRGVARGRRVSASVGDQGIKKRRTRNAQQMEMNRIAQAKYRERKKAEQEDLQNAVDKLAAKIAAFKVLEAKAQNLEAHNATLQSTLADQNVAIVGLQQQAGAAGAELVSARGMLAQSQEVVGRQQAMILDQHAKMALQNEVIECLKEQLREKIDQAMSCVQPGSVCDKLVGAVKAALYGAKNMEGLQEQLDKLPSELTTEICCNIFKVVRDSFPELKARCHELARLEAGLCVPGARCTSLDD